MPGALFGKVCHMSLLGCYCTVIVLLARRFLLFLGCGRKYAYYLWMVVFANLCIPFSVSGIFSLIPGQIVMLSEEAELSAGADLQEVHVYSAEEMSPAAGTDTISSAPLSEETGDGSPAKRTNEEEGADRTGRNLWEMVWKNRITIWNLAGCIWLLGLSALFLYHVSAAVRFDRKLKKMTGEVPEKEKGIVRVKGLPSPFLWGLLHPVIYLPAGMEEPERSYILAHETYHRKRRDHLIRPLIFGITLIHWFNPLVWLAYDLCCKDMEISCDEAVLSGSRKNIRKYYAESLLKYAARQNGYSFRPLTFGEPSVKSRIRNVLHYRKKSAFFSCLAVVFVLAVTLGLLFRPAGGEQEADISELSGPETDGEVSGDQEQQPGTLAVVNNGGEVIRVNGELYYIDGQPLYSDGQKLYTSRVNEDGAWAFYTYELDGSGYEKLLDGKVVGWEPEQNCPYIWTAVGDTSVGTPGAPGLYLWKNGEPLAVAYTTDQFLGVDGEYGYFARKEDDGVYVNRYRAGDGQITERFIGTAIETEMITEFYAERDYLLFAAGNFSGSMGNFEGDFFSYNQVPGRLFHEHLTESGAFTAADGYLYYQKYEYPGDGTNDLYRVSYDLTGEELVGKGLTFRAYDASTETILAEKESGEQGISNLVRISPDGSGEQLLLDMTKVLESSLDDGNGHLDWTLADGDKIQFSEINLLGDLISVKAEQWGYREEADAGWRDSLIASAYIQIRADGSTYGFWSPETLWQDQERSAQLQSAVVGEPCEPEVASYENGLEIRAAVVYEDGGHFSLADFQAENSVFWDG